MAQVSLIVRGGQWLNPDGGRAKLGAFQNLCKRLAVPLSIITLDTRWLTREQAGEHLPAAALSAWLFDEGSLTRRLTALAEGAFSVTPLLEGWQPLRDDECAVLGLAAQSIGWVREVYLHGHGQPWVFARSVAARTALEAGGLHLDALGSRSLGELLFSDAAFERGLIETCRYPAAWLPVSERAQALWARRSCFTRGPLQVLVAEVFLPRLWQYLEV